MTTNGNPDATIAALITRLTADLGEVSAAASATGAEFRRGSQLFAVLHGGQVSLRLRLDIAAAALGTPATVASPRGADWIEFAPDPSNQQDVDRLQAWLTIGWRSAQRHN